MVLHTTPIPLSDEEKAIIINERSQMLSYSAIAFNIHREESTVRKFHHRWIETKTFTHQMGRPKTITPGIEAAVIRHTVFNRRASIRDVANQSIPTIDLPSDSLDGSTPDPFFPSISRESVRLIRHKFHYHYYDSIPIPPMTDKHKAMRVQFCEGILSSVGILPILFTDESLVSVNLDKGGIWRLKNEFVSEAFFEKNAHNTSVMVWGGITNNFRTPLLMCPKSITTETYLGMLADHTIFKLLIEKFGKNGFIWQQDNAPPQQPTFSVIEEGGFNILHWPPHSPDLSPIEMIWAIIKRKLRGKLFSTPFELFRALECEWNQFTPELINSYVTSFEIRCRICLKYNGECLNGHWQEVHQLHKAQYPVIDVI
jgi:hypothetical protein